MNKFGVFLKFLVWILFLLELFASVYYLCVGNESMFIVAMSGLTAYSVSLILLYSV